jgi:drug/metabolite transporter (DMT)-like permease
VTQHPDSALGPRHSALHIHAALSGVALLFSLNYIISKLSLHAFTPLTFAYVRVLGSALILNLLFRERNPPPLSPADRWRVVGYSVLGVVINQVLFLSGLALTSAHVSAILMTLIPVFTLAAAIFIGRERASAAKIGGIALALAGALAVVGREGLSGTGKSLIGDLLLIGNAFAYALYLVFSKRDMARLSPRRVIARMFAIGAILMLPICAWSLWREPWASIPRSAWISLVLVIAGPTVAAYLLNAWALAHTDSSLVATYTYVQPLLTMILASIFLGETVRPIAIVAAALILGGVYLAGRPAPPAARPEAIPGNPD